MPGKNKMPSARDAKACQSCGGTSSRLFACDRCFLVTYCSQRCCELDWVRHKDDCRFVTWHRKHVGRNFCHHCFVKACPHTLSKLKRCGGCLRVSYCSKQCQEDDWEAHNPLCTNDKNRKTKETLLNEQLMRDDLAKQAIDAMRDSEYVNEDSSSTDKSSSRKKGKKKQQQQLHQKEVAIESVTMPQPNSEKTQTVVMEKCTTQPKSHPSQPTVQHHYRIKISNKPFTPEGRSYTPASEGTPNTESFETEVREPQADGSYIIKKRFITNGISHSNQTIDEIARKFGSNFKITKQEGFDDD